MSASVEISFDASHAGLTRWLAAKGKPPISRLQHLAALKSNGALSTTTGSLVVKCDRLH